MARTLCLQFSSSLGGRSERINGLRKLALVLLNSLRNLELQQHLSGKRERKHQPALSSTSAPNTARHHIALASVVSR